MFKRAGIVAGSLVVAATFVIGTTVGMAAADSSDAVLITTQCDNGQTVTVEVVANGNGFPSAVHVIDSTSVFTIHQFTLTSKTTGETFFIKNDNGVAQNHDLVSCSHPGHNFDFTWTGFFTPAQ